MRDNANKPKQERDRNHWNEYQDNWRLVYNSKSMRPDEWLTIVITKEHRAKICMDLICEFLHQRPDDSMWKPNMCVKDYSLEQFQWRVWNKIKYSEKSANKKMNNDRLKRIRSRKN